MDCIVALWIVVALWLAALTDVDVRSRRLPNTLTMPAVIAVAVSAVAHPAVIAALCTGLLPYLIAYMAGSCGGGDVKLATALAGVTIHVTAVCALLILAALFTLVTAMIVGGRHPRVGQSFAHGPALCLAAVVVWTVL